MTFPAIPSWDGIHPAMAQFSIVLLWTAPVFLIVSLFSRRSWRTWAGAALLAMALGSFASWLAVASGHAAGQLVDKTPVLERAIASHEALGLQTRNLFTVLTLVFAPLIALPGLLRRPLPAAARIGLHAVFVVAYLGFTIVIAHTASQGGRLVHGLGVRAVVGGTEAREQVAGGTATPPAAPGGSGDAATPAGAPDSP